MDSLARCFGELTQIKHDARDRLAGSGERVIPATVGMLGFESPPPAALPGIIDVDENDPPSEPS